MILADTHVLVWADGGSDLLGSDAKATVQRAWERREIGVSAVTFWECAALQRRGLVELRSFVGAWRAELLAAGLVEHAIDGRLGIMALELEMPLRDPADRLIVATAMAYDLTLLTADRALLRWKRGPRMQDARR